MSNLKRIVLVACASNFESHNQVVTSVIDTMKELGGYSLDILTSYGRFGNYQSEYEEAERSVYELLKKKKYDGAILDSNIGREDMLHEFEHIFKENGTPYVAIGTEILDCPSYCQNSYQAVNDLINHIISEHNAKKINLVVRSTTIENGDQTLNAYEDILKKRGIDLDYDRVFESLVGLDEGEALYDKFIAKGKEDAEAVIVFHDVNAIGLISEYERRGIRVPEDVKVVSLHYSTNSMIYKPDVTGVAVEDAMNAKEAMYGLHSIINGDNVNNRNYSEAGIIYGKSCGCINKNDRIYNHNSSKNVVVSKISNANQIQVMMEYNQSLYNISTIDELGKATEKMLEEIGCGEFYLCVNERDMQYLTTGDAIHKTNRSDPFDDNMCLVVSKDNQLMVKDLSSFSIENIIPTDPVEGDFNIILPVHSGAEVFGYIIIKNSIFPVDVYNYRICHESIGNSFEELHRQVVLRSTIEKLDKMRLMDHMTGTYNKSGLKHFEKEYFSNQSSVVVMIDVDGLKSVNDQYGHLQGDLVIQISADAILKAVHEDDVVVRYGGDEFLVLSLHKDSENWSDFQNAINNEIKTAIEKRNLEYSFGVSVGYEYYVPERDDINSVIKRADSKMYENKMMRKAQR